MIRPGRPSVTVFAVEDTTAQVTWRNLAPGPLHVAVPNTDVAIDLVLDDAGTAPEMAGIATGPGARAGAVELSGLPPDTAFTVEATGEAVDRAVGPGRGPLRARARTLTRLPGEELSRAATISDLHLGTWVFGHRGTIVETPTPADAHPVRCAGAAIDELTAWGAQELVVKGDITNYGKPDEWRSFRQLLDRTEIPVTTQPGNHDRPFPPPDPRALDPEDAARIHGFSLASPCEVRDLPGLRIVVVDTTDPGQHGGRLFHVEDDVFDALAETRRSGAVLLTFHQHLHPLIVPEGVPVGIGHLESRRFLDLVGQLHPHVVITSGHTHRHRRWQRSGVTVTQVGSTKDFPGVWAGYVAHEGGFRQVVRRVHRPDCIAWTDRSRRAAFGAWEHLSPGMLSSRCFDLPFTEDRPGRP